MGGTAAVYLAGTTTAASVYTTETIVAAVNSVTGSSTDGTFEFWVSDSDYTNSQKFKIVLSKAGYTSVTWDNQNILDKTDYVYEPDAFTGSSITAALASIGSTVSTLLLRPGTWVISSAADWSAYTNATFKIVPGAVISHGAFTVNIPNPEAGMYQILSGTGLVTFSGSYGGVLPEWFGTAGDFVTDDTVPLQKAWDSFKASNANKLVLNKNYHTTVANNNIVYSDTHTGTVWQFGQVDGPFFEKLGTIGSTTNTRLQVPLQYIREAAWDQSYTDTLKVGTIKSFGDARMELHNGSFRFQAAYGLYDEGLYSILKLAFTSGGTYVLEEGDTITGEISGAIAIVDQVTVTSGSFVGENAAGTIYFASQTGTFQAETLKVGANLDIATISGDSSTVATLFTGTAKRVTANVAYRANGGDAEIMVNKNSSSSERQGISWKRDFFNLTTYNETSLSPMEVSGNTGLWYVGLANEPANAPLTNRNTDNLMIGYQQSPLKSTSKIWFEMPSLGVGATPDYTETDFPYKYKIEIRSLLDFRAKGYDAGTAFNPWTFRVEENSLHAATTRFARVINEDRTGQEIWSVDASDNMRFPVSNGGPNATSLTMSQGSFYINETTHHLWFVVRYSDNTTVRSIDLGAMSP